MRYNDDLVYLFRRSVEERVRAEAATHESARAAHSTLARAYEERLRSQPIGLRWLESALPAGRRNALPLLAGND